MHIVLIPLLFLIVVCLFKKIPVIGGNFIVAFIGAGILALTLGQAYSPSLWVPAWIKSFDSIAYIAFIIVFGSFFSTLQVESGAMDTVLNILRAIFGKTSQGLILATLIALFFGGSLMGTVAAIGAVVGIIIVPVMDDIGMDPDLICATIVTGASMGGMMPPVSNAIILACGLIGIEPSEALMISYITVGIGMLLIVLLFCKVYVGRKYSLPTELIPKETAGVIFKKNWKKLIPLFVLMTLILINSIPAIKFDLPKWLMNQIKFGDKTFYAVFSKITIIGKLANNIVSSMIIGVIMCFICDRGLIKKSKDKMIKQAKGILEPEAILIVTAFFLGAFKVGGQNAEITAWASGLSRSLLIFGGSGALVAAGMLTGGQSTSQSMLVPLLAPAWEAIGITPLKTVLASSHLAMAGQGLPPADLNTFIIAGLVGGILGKKVNPMKSMIYSAPYCIYLAVVGLLFFYI